MYYSSSTKFRLTATFALIFVMVIQALSQWSTDPKINNAICVATGNQHAPKITSDITGGAIITWIDYRGGTSSAIYAQRINAAGTVLWTGNGVPICTAKGNQIDPEIISDGVGGAIITWLDYRNGVDYNVYAQRINATGVRQWADTGVAICTAPDNQRTHTIVSDGAGGAIIPWYDFRSGIDDDIYVQRINAAGIVQWTANGVAVCTAAGSQIDPTIASDGAEGGIITWTDARSNNDIYAQRINAEGVVRWTANGVAISTATGDQLDPSIVSDSTGGAILTWVDTRGGNWDIFTQRINAAGAVQWTADGVSICSATGDQGAPLIISDGAGGAIIAWYDGRDNANLDIYAQRVSATGNMQWTADGVPISAAAGNQGVPTITTDGVGGAIIAWADRRSVTDFHIYAQRINSTGTVRWTADGVAICTAANTQWIPRIVGDDGGGAIITWIDGRSGGVNNHIYAQLVNAKGQLGLVTGIRNVAGLPESFRLEQNYPNPFNPTTQIRFAVAASGLVSVKVFNLIGQEISTLVDKELHPGNYEVPFDASGLPSGVYFCRMTVSGSVAIRAMMLMK